MTFLYKAQSDFYPAGWVCSPVSENASGVCHFQTIGQDPKHKTIFLYFPNQTHGPLPEPSEQSTALCRTVQGPHHILSLSSAHLPFPSVFLPYHAGRSWDKIDDWNVALVGGSNCPVERKHHSHLETIGNAAEFSGSKRVTQINNPNQKFNPRLVLIFICACFNSSPLPKMIDDDSNGGSQIAFSSTNNLQKINQMNLNIFVCSNLLLQALKSINTAKVLPAFVFISSDYRVTKIFKKIEIKF